jgi:hypothetical protein
MLGGRNHPAFVRCSPDPILVVSNVYDDDILSFSEVPAGDCFFFLAGKICKGAFRVVKKVRRLYFYINRLCHNQKPAKLYMKVWAITFLNRLHYFKPPGDQVRWENSTMNLFSALRINGKGI